MNIFDEAIKIHIYNEGDKKTFLKGEPDFEALLQALREILNESHEMPAFSVSMDHLTREMMKTETVIEFEMDKRRIHREMPYDKLLINVKAEYCGFNVEREINGKYIGRNYYFDIKNDMKTLYNKIKLLK